MDKKTKTEVKEKWLKSFPDLSGYTQNKLYKIIGPFVLGIELINLPRSENYRPHFVIYSLYKENIKSCLEYPVLMSEFYNARKLQLNLAANDSINEVQDIISRTLKVKFDQDILLGQFFNLIDDYLCESRVECITF